jgi:RNA polymerase sigma-70 factor (ECF subfamily)
MASPSIKQVALAELYRALAPRVYWHALRLLHNSEDARDVMHDAFLALLHQSNCPQGAASSLALLCQIATHKAIDNLRRRSRWSDMPGFLRTGMSKDAEYWGDLEMAHSDNTARVDAQSDLAQITRNESAQALTAAVLYFVEGYTFEEVGYLLSLSRKTTSKLLQQFSRRVRRRARQSNPPA